MKKILTLFCAILGMSATMNAQDDQTESNATVYCCSMTFDINSINLSSGNYFAVFVYEADGTTVYWTLGFSDVVVTVDGQIVDMTKCTGYNDEFDSGCLKLFESWGSLATTPIPANAGSLTLTFNLSARWGDVTEDEFSTLLFTVQIDPAEGNELKPTYSASDILVDIITAISSITSDTDAVEVARYNLLGQKISGVQKGINIIVYSDGSSKKVLVK